MSTPPPLHPSHLHRIDDATGGTVYRITAPGDASGARIDKLLAEALPDVSRARLKALIAEGAVRASCDPSAEDFVPVSDAARKARPGVVYEVRIPPARPAEPEAEPMALDVLYEDAHVIVIDKPAGLAVHPAPGNEAGTLVNALLAHCGDSLSGIGGIKRPGIVHRLDKDTSGVMVAAKTDAAHRALAAQFAAHGADGALARAYLALVWGAPRRQVLTIDAPVGRHPGDRKKMAVVAQASGRRAVTHVTVRRRYGAADAPAAALLECRLETGRTHQIRVHLAQAGHPVIGDPLYGRGFKTRIATLPDPARTAAEAMHRQALHAWLLGFRHPQTGEAMRFTAGPPADMARLIAALEAM